MLETFILIPFIMAFLFTINVFTKNPIHIRRSAKLFFLLYFIFASYIVIIPHKNMFSFLGINFLANETNLIYIFITSLIFLLLSIFSKNFIYKLHKLYHATSFLLLGLTNLALMCDGIFTFLVSLFWIFLVEYLLSSSFSLKKSHDTIDKHLLSNLFCLILGSALIIKEFARFFIVNELNFSFSNLKNFLYKIDDLSILYAFFGFLIITCRLLKLTPFVLNKINSTNLFVTITNSIIAFVLGCTLFIKCYSNFDYLFYQYQDEISIFLIFNFIINTFLILSQKKIFNFLNSAIIINLIIMFFTTFSFTKESTAVFISGSIILLVSFCFTSLMFTFLEDKFKTDNIENFKRINDKSKITQFLLFLSLLNFAPIPLTALFYVIGTNFLMLFSTKYESEILTYIPYILIFGYLLYSISIYAFAHKTIIEPTEKTKNPITLHAHQKMVCFALLFLLIFFCFTLHNFLNIY